MKKITAILLCLILTVCGFSACGGGRDEVEGGLIVCTSFVIADWVENIIGDTGYFYVSVLGDEGKDMHNFQPAAADMREILSCELLVYVGGESDKWVESVALGNGTAVIRLFDLVEGVHCDGCLDGDGHDHEDVPDEHIWLSLENPVAVVNAVTEELCLLDGDNSDAYYENRDAYLKKIEALGNSYASAVETAKYKTLVFADRFPFVYLMNELDIEYFAAFPGCSSETTASFETVISLALEVDSGELPCVLVLEDSADGIAETVVSNTSARTAEILALDSMQIYRSDDDFDYVKAMEKNLSVLKKALGAE